MRGGSSRGIPDVGALLARTALFAHGASAAEHRVPLTFEEIADALETSRLALESGGIFTAAMLDRVIATLRV